VRQRDALVGLGLGLGVNFALARLAPGVSWLWWNPAGFLSATLTALVLAGPPLSVTARAVPPRVAVLLGGAFALILALLLALPRG
jgi:hypothetical protein